MAHPKGQITPSPVVNGSENSRYGTHFDYLGIGGYLVVRTMAERDAIPVNTSDLGLNFGDDLSSGRRRLGMRVRVLDPAVDDVFELRVDNYFSITATEKYYALASNENWISIEKNDSPVTAQSVTFDNTNSDLQAKNVQGALEEIGKSIVGNPTVRTEIPITQAGQTEFALSVGAVDLGKSDLYLNGVRQLYGPDYTGSGTSLRWVSLLRLDPLKHSLYIVYKSI